MDVILLIQVTIEALDKPLCIGKAEKSVIVLIADTHQGITKSDVVIQPV